MTVGSFHSRRHFTVDTIGMKMKETFNERENWPEPFHNIC